LSKIRRDLQSRLSLLRSVRSEIFIAPQDSKSLSARDGCAAHPSLAQIIMCTFNYKHFGPTDRKLEFPMRPTAFSSSKLWPAISSLIVLFSPQLSWRELIR